MALGYLLEPFIQVNTIVGTPVVGAKIYVYKGNTSVLATTYNDFEGHLNTNPVRTNTLGNCTIIADDSISYDIEIRDALGLLLMSKKNITIGNAASGSGELVVEAGYGIEVTRTQGSWKVAVDTDLIATQDDLTGKQDKLQAGANIEITDDNTVNVVNRREVVTEWPIKLERGNNRVKFYIDDDYANQFKTTQTAVEYGGEAGKYISYILQNENGEIEATTAVLPQATTYSAGTDLKLLNGVFSVDTDSIVSGTQNFAAGHSNNVSGNYNATFGASNIINGANANYNIVAGYNNNVNGGDNNIFGYNNNVTANYCGIIGNDITLTADNSYAFGNPNSAVDGGFVFGSDSKNDFEIRADHSVWYNHNNNLYRLTPSDYINSEKVTADAATYVVLAKATGVYDFDIMGNFDNSADIVISPNSNSRSLTVIVNGDYDNPITVPGNGQQVQLKSVAYFGNSIVKIEIFGMGVGSDIPRWVYTIFTESYVDRRDYYIYKEQEYGN